ncbi:conjugal transfer protein TraG N-terminal domain-containing protein, partial [Vibrio owensii]|uniref:conjugal transfer protein TraG N-terminal domain-containing protein n=1 Tax=Vibrio owensii TaxID=696485 RepID=UPI004067C162
MEFTIYTAGHFDFMWSIWNGLAMAFDSNTGDYGSPNTLMGIGLVLAFFIGGFSGLLDKGQGDWLLAVKGWLLWSLLFVPRVDVVLEHSATGEVDYFSDIPAGLAIGGAVATGIPVAFVDTLGVIFTMPYYNGDHINAFKTLLTNDKVLVSNPNLGLYDGSGNRDLNESIVNYINDCVVVDMNIGGAGQEVFPIQLSGTTDVWQSMRVTSEAWFTTVRLGSGEEIKSCKDAYNSIDTYLGDSTSAFGNAINTELAKSGLNMNDVQNAMLQMGTGSLQAFNMQVNTFLDYHLAEVAQGRSDGSAISRYYDGITYQAKQQRIASMTGDSELWMMIAPVIITVLEAMIWFFAPLLSFMVLLGKGLPIVGKYLRFLVVVGMFPVVSIVINMYLDWSITELIEPNAVTDNMWSIAGMHSFYTTAEDYVAMSGYLTAAIPMLAYAIVSGSDYMVSSLASRMGSTAHVNAEAAAPSVSKANSAGVYSFGSEGLTQTPNGIVHTRSAIQDFGQTSFGTKSVMQSSARESLQSTRSEMSSLEQSMSTGFGQRFMSGVQGNMQTSSGQEVSSGMSENQRSMMSAAHQIKEQTGVSTDKAANMAVDLAVKAGAMTPGMGKAFKASLGVGVDGKGAYSEKEMKSAGEALGFSMNKDGSIGAEYRDSESFRKAFGYTSSTDWGTSSNKTEQEMAKWAENYQKAETLEKSIGRAVSFDSPAMTDFRNAGNNEQWERYVSQGDYNFVPPERGRQETEESYAKRLNQSRSDHQAGQEARISNEARLFDGDRGKAAAQVYQQDIKNMMDSTYSGNSNGFESGITSIASSLRDAGQILADPRFNVMANNLEKFNSNQNMDIKSPERPESVPERGEVSQKVAAHSSDVQQQTSTYGQQSNVNGGDSLKGKFDNNKSQLQSDDSFFKNQPSYQQAMDILGRVNRNNTLSEEPLMNEARVVSGAVFEGAAGFVNDVASGFVSLMNTSGYTHLENTKGNGQGFDGAFYDKLMSMSPDEASRAVRQGANPNASPEQKEFAVKAASFFTGENATAKGVYDSLINGNMPHDSSAANQLLALGSSIGNTVENLPAQNAQQFNALVNGHNSGQLSSNDLKGFFNTASQEDVVDKQTTSQLNGPISFGSAKNMNRPEQFEHNAKVVSYLDSNGQGETVGNTSRQQFNDYVDRTSGVTSLAPQYSVAEKNQALAFEQNLKADKTTDTPDMAYTTASQALLANDLPNVTAGYIKDSLVDNQGSFAHSNAEDHKNAVRDMHDQLMMNPDAVPPEMANQIREAYAMVQQGQSMLETGQTETSTGNRDNTRYTAFYSGSSVSDDKFNDLSGKGEGGLVQVTSGESRSHDSSVILTKLGSDPNTNDQYAFDPNSAQYLKIGSEQNSVLGGHPVSQISAEDLPSHIKPIQDGDERLQGKLPSEQVTPKGTVENTMPSMPAYETYKKHFSNNVDDTQVHQERPQADGINFQQTDALNSGVQLQTPSVAQQSSNEQGVNIPQNKQSVSQDGNLLASSGADSAQTGNDDDQPWSNGTNTPNDVGTPTQVASVAIQPSDEPRVSQTPTQPAAAQQDGNLLAANGVDSAQTGNDDDQPWSNGTNTPNDVGTPTQVASVAIQPSDEPRVSQTPTQPAAAQQDGNLLAANGVDSAQTGNDDDQPWSNGTNT